jgi:hypothetical protein
MALMSTFVDNFATADGAKWTYVSGASIVGGQLQITCASTYVSLFSVNSYDLTNNSFIIEVPQIGGPGGSAETILKLHGTYPLLLAMFVSGSDLAMRFDAGIGGVSEWNTTTVTFDPTSMRWWRIADNAGTTTWDTSPDGQTWTTRRTATSGVVVTSLSVELACGYYGTETSPRVAIFDNVNNPPAGFVRTLGDSTGTSDTVATVGGSKGRLFSTKHRSHVGKDVYAHYSPPEEMFYGRRMYDPGGNGATVWGPGPPTSHDYVVDHNIWAYIDGFTQHLYANSSSDWYVIGNDNGNPNPSGQVVTYPNAGCLYWGKPGATIPGAVDSWATTTSSWDVSIPHDTNTSDDQQGFVCWAAYDMWLNNYQREIMIQVDISCPNNPDHWAPVFATATFSGEPWHLCSFGDIATGELVWKRGVDEAHLVNKPRGTVNIREFMDWMETPGNGGPWESGRWIPQNSLWAATSFGFELLHTWGKDAICRVNDFSWTAT